MALINKFGKESRSKSQKPKSRKPKTWLSKSVIAPPTNTPALVSTVIWKFWENYSTIILRIRILTIRDFGFHNFVLLGIVAATVGNFDWETSKKYDFFSIRTFKMFC